MTAKIMSVKFGTRLRFHFCLRSVLVAIGSSTRNTWVHIANSRKQDYYAPSNRKVITALEHVDTWQWMRSVDTLYRFKCSAECRFNSSIG